MTFNHYIAWAALFGPKLHRLHRGPNNVAVAYKPNLFEKTGDFFITWMVTFYNFAYCISPFLAWTLWRRNMFTRDGVVTLFSYGVSASIFLGLSSGVRAVGRILNSDYIDFARILYRARQGQLVDIRKYDFDFWAWPVDYYWNEGPRGGFSPSLRRLPHVEANEVSGINSIPWKILYYLVANTVGVRLLYPGSVSFLQTALNSHLLQGRAKLVEEKGGRRAKVCTKDGNDIDTIFIDRRQNKKDDVGNILVICSEGNAGFYEIGITGTPIDAGYSVLGWNHPGFSGSSGTPFPDQEQHAIDAVMQYATQRLNFPPGSIILFAWSIGGYPATFAAMNYPEAKAVILDATFDHVLPLALARMPEAVNSVIAGTVLNHANLNNAQQLLRYPGPVLLIRRTKDEMISTKGPPDPIDIKTNRGNNLLVMLLSHRYPGIVTKDTEATLRDYLSLNMEHDRISFLKDFDVQEEHCLALLQSYIDSQDSSQPLFPISLQPSLQEAKQLTLFLATKYMKNFDSSHCTPLPTRLFQMPWELKRR